MNPAQTAAVREAIARMDLAAYHARENAANHLRIGQPDKADEATARAIELYHHIEALNSLLGA